MKNAFVGFAVLILVGCGCSPNYSDGERIGVVTKISRKGMLFKSWEASALIALPSATSGQIQPEQFNFNVSDEAAEAVKSAAATGRRVKLSYHQWLIGPATIQNNYVVFKVDSL